MKEKRIPIENSPEQQAKELFEKFKSIPMADAVLKVVEDKIDFKNALIYHEPSSFDSIHKIIWADVVNKPFCLKINGYKEQLFLNVCQGKVMDYKKGKDLTGVFLYVGNTPEVFAGRCYMNFEYGSLTYKIYTDTKRLSLPDKDGNWILNLFKEINKTASKLYNEEQPLFFGSDKVIPQPNRKAKA